MNRMSILSDFIDIPSARHFGHYVTLVCPFHSSYPVRNSLFIYEDFFICQSCGKKGNNLGYLLNALNSGSTIHFEQKKFHNPWNDWIRDYGSVFGACKEAYKSLKNFPQQRYYLNKRGIPNSEIETLKLGYLSGWYTIPFLGQSGDLLGGVCRAGEGFKENVNKYVTPKGQDNKRILYVPGGWEALNTAKSVFLTFGILSSVSVWLCGKSALSTVSGTTLDVDALSEIRKPIYIIPDLGEEDKARKLADQLSWRGKVIIPEYTDTLHDANDLFVHDIEKLRRNLNVETR